MRKCIGSLLKIGVFSVAATVLIPLTQTMAAAKGQLTLKGNDNKTYQYNNGKLDQIYTGMTKDESTGGKYWFDSGVMACDKEAFDPVSRAWYWFDADGTMAVGKDAFIPTNIQRTEGKWVRYNKDGSMVKGEDYRYGGWYWFNPVTGEMIKGFVNISDDTRDGKWVYYDDITGQMHHGESYINNSWYRFDDYTGKMVHGEYCDSEGNWYYYDDITGIMQKGSVYHDGNWYYYDECTGIMQKGNVTRGDDQYYYDPVTGVMQKGSVYHDGGWYYYDLITGILVRSGENAGPTDEYLMNYAKKSLDLQNQIRSEHGVASLEWDSELFNSVYIRGEEIAEKFSHTRPDGTSCFSAITTAYRAAGENIAYGYQSAESVTNAWYNSEGHRRNMLNSSFTSAAVVCYRPTGKSTLYWVTVFIGRRN